MIKIGIEPSAVTLSTLINGLCKQRKIYQAMSLFDGLKEGIEPDVVTYNTLVDAHCKKGMVSEAEDIVDTMRKEGIEPNVVTYSILVDANCKKGMVSIAEDIVETMRKEGIEPNVVTYNTLMKERNIPALPQTNKSINGSSLELLITASGKATILYLGHLILVDAYCKEGLIFEAVDTVHTMRKQGLKPDVVPYTTLVDAYCKKGMVYEAEVIVDTMRRQGIEPDVVMYSTLVDARCKKGMKAVVFFEAEDVVDTMKARIEPNVVTHHSYASKAGHIEVAKEVFGELSVKGLIPDVYTYTLIIKGFCKVGLPDEAYQMFRSMEENGCSPNSCCYNVMIQGLLRNSYMS
ncbi:pentatricopeptide repeat-containing protein At1g63130, mitochondrial-like [Hibiscus syriacus]|uniref:pentatricopeptide repeat-containing protein At1g63130, mitochondrial-like n=1 Tax=Hibiscus syriacus TaxID=106335 RepID=UPI0019209CF3|nr:pentatricopeptide repeat-containing protein At1g63130, mitochondrial-like [Hibiscus syriacus]